jgi:hypothetical protein
MHIKKHAQLKLDDQEFREMLHLAENQYIEEVDIFFDNIGGYWVIDAIVHEHCEMAPTEGLPF